MAASQYSKLDDPEILRVLFHPRIDHSATTTGRVELLDMLTDDGVRLGCRFSPAEQPDAPIILFFHGNGEIASDYDDAAELYNESGLSFLAAEYRGYGRSQGVPSASTMMADCHAIFKQVTAMLQEQGRSGPLLVMGRSLGCASAIELAAHYSDQIKGLIIESGFAMTLPLLLALGIDIEEKGLIEQDGFQNAQKIGRITMPTFILHAQYDQIIPVASAEILQSQSAAKSKEFQMVPNADHNTIQAVAGRHYYVAIRQFINKIMKIRPRRSTRQR